MKRSNQIHNRVVSRSIQLTCTPMTSFPPQVKHTFVLRYKHCNHFKRPKYTNHETRSRQCYEGYVQINNHPNRSVWRRIREWVSKSANYIQKTLVHDANDQYQEGGNIFRTLWRPPRRHCFFAFPPFPQPLKYSCFHFPSTWPILELNTNATILALLPTRQ